MSDHPRLSKMPAALQNADESGQIPWDSSPGSLNHFNLVLNAVKRAVDWHSLAVDCHVSRSLIKLSLKPTEAAFRLLLLFRAASPCALHLRLLRQFDLMPWMAAKVGNKEMTEFELDLSSFPTVFFRLEASFFQRGIEPSQEEAVWKAASKIEAEINRGQLEIPSFAAVAELLALSDHLR